MPEPRGRLAAPHALQSHLGGLSRTSLRFRGYFRENYTPTESQRLALIAQGVRDVRVLGRGVDVALFNPRFRSPAVRQALLQPDEECMFLYVGRLSSEKNIDSLASMIATVPRARLVVVGDSPKRAQLERRFRGLPATFLDARFDRELATLYASADVFSFPSLTETFGQVVQEAMASGLAVLAYRAGGVQDLFRHEEEGNLCAPAMTGNGFRPRECSQAARRCVRGWVPTHGRPRSIAAGTAFSPGFCRTMPIWRISATP